MKQLHVFAITFLVFASSLIAREEPFLTQPDLTGTSIATGTVEAIDIQYQEMVHNPNWDQDFHNVKIEAQAYVGINQHYTSIVGDFDYDITLTIHYETWNSIT